ncbi:hypothetical protein QNI19_14615 [Cytophagaceae bacterium DM2B3-1]|uniref:Uncharacterized protein n=1 Tax=Xanthocytophaga flava TaxID=3048013 RepID=A0ABT7CKG0_9BACT|nr:hypothetical protein [Xanthocytophaga flavus]MDJ1494173.1 hypothetical protein [Xanthocytophaga flavus]
MNNYRDQLDTEILQQKHEFSKGIPAVRHFESVILRPNVLLIHPNDEKFLADEVHRFMPDQLFETYSGLKLIRSFDIAEGKPKAIFMPDIEK